MRYASISSGYVAIYTKRGFFDGVGQWGDLDDTCAVEQGKKTDCYFRDGRELHSGLGETAEGQVSY